MFHFFACWAASLILLLWHLQMRQARICSEVSNKCQQKALYKQNVHVWFGGLSIPDPKFISWGTLLYLARKGTTTNHFASTTGFQEHGVGGEGARQGHQLDGAAEDHGRHGQVRVAVRGAGREDFGKEEEEATL